MNLKVKPWGLFFLKRQNGSDLQLRGAEKRSAGLFREPADRWGERLRWRAVYMFGRDLRVAHDYR